jgi:hypothetical protein
MTNPLLASPMLTPEAIRAAEPWRTVWHVDEADPEAGRQPTSYTLKAEDIARAFLAAQDREALAGVAHRALLDLHRGAAVYVQARAVIDALLGAKEEGADPS